MRSSQRRCHPQLELHNPRGNDDEPKESRMVARPTDFCQQMIRLLLRHEDSINASCPDQSWIIFIDRHQRGVIRRIMQVTKEWHWFGISAWTIHPVLSRGSSKEEGDELITGRPRLASTSQTPTSQTLKTCASTVSMRR